MSKLVKKVGSFFGGKPQQSTPQLFGAAQLRTPEETKAFQRVTPSLVERGLQGVDPRERRRLKTRAFEDIGATTKQSLEGLRETFGRTGVRGGVQGADVADIIEAAIGATGRASTEAEEISKLDEQQRMTNLLALLAKQSPFAVSQKQVGARKGFLELAGEAGQAVKQLSGTTLFS